MMFRLLIAALLSMGAACATGFTDVSIADDLTVTDDATISGNLAVAGTATITGALTQTGAVSITGDLTLGGGPGAITTSADGTATWVAADADATALCMGAAGALDLMCLDTTNASPALDIKGVAGQVGFHLDAGTAQLDENPTIGAGVAATDYVVTINGETNDCSWTCMEDENRSDINGNLQFGSAGAGVDYTLTVDGETSDGSITYMEDEDRWDFAEAVAITGALTTTGELNGAIMQTDEVAVSNGELLALRATNKTLVAAKGANTIIRPVSVLFFLDYGSAQCTESADNLALNYVDAAGEPVCDSDFETTASFLVAAADGYGMYSCATNIIATTAQAVNTAVTLDNNGDGEFGTCTGSTMTVWITYYVIDVS